MDGPLGQSYHLASKELCLPIFYLETYSMLTHQQIPLPLLCAAGCILIQQLKLLFLQHLAIPGFPQSDHIVILSASSVRTLVHCET